MFRVIYNIIRNETVLKFTAILFLGHNHFRFSRIHIRVVSGTGRETSRECSKGKPFSKSTVKQIQKFLSVEKRMKYRWSGTRMVWVREVVN